MNTARRRSVRDKAHAAVAAYLRDEILDIDRQARSERRLDDEKTSRRIPRNAAMPINRAK